MCSWDEGTIIEELNKRRYKIDQDDESTTKASKLEFKLAQEPSKLYKGNVAKDHKAENPPTTYSKIGVAGFNSSLFDNLDRGSGGYHYPYMKIILVRNTLNYLISV